MKVLIAPDKFAGTLTAPQAAHAIAEGWARHAPDDVLTLAPMADGGPGFIDVLAGAVEGEVLAVAVRGPLGEDVPVTMFKSGDTVHIESAQACGLQLVTELRPLAFSTYGVGQAVLAAIGAGARRIVLGLGGSATNDGGAGLLAALGATADVPLDRGPEPLRGVSVVDLSPARAALQGTELVIATDVDLPLLGMFGATKTFGPQKGLSDADIIRVDGLLDAFVDVTAGTAPSQRAAADVKGAGAAGGLGFALLLLGARRISGIDLVAEAVGLADNAARHDLVISGEGSYDFSSRAGKVVFGVAEAAGAAARPCIVLAGRVDVGSREMRAMGVESAYSASELVGEKRSLAEPYGSLAILAERVARTWSQ